VSVEPLATTGAALAQTVRLVEVMEVLRRRCPWDAEQTHRSLVQYLLEESAETVEAIESGDSVHLQEELGDLLLQVVFHAEIATAFDLEDVARGIADKLVSRHPHVFAPAGGSGVPEEVPADLHHTWEQRKAVEEGRTSALQGIPEQMSALARGHKIVARSRSRRVPLELPDEPVTADEVGAQVLALVARAHASGVDPEQAVRDAVRGLERRVGQAETRSPPPAQH
jgi:XTP/dITP diphosphohydrolase